MPRKSVILNFRVTPEIHDRLTDEAHSLGLSLSGLCSDRVLSRPVNLNLQANMAKILQGVKDIMTKLETLELALKGAQAETANAQAVEADLRQQIRDLQAGVKAKAAGNGAKPSPSGRRGPTEEGRAAIAAAQERRWARVRAEKAAEAGEPGIDDPINQFPAATEE